MASKPTLPAEGRLECPICLEEFTDPRMLPCLHTMCRHCIESLVSALGQKVRCPTCRNECQVPTEGVCGFPKNFFLNDMKELLQELNKLRTGGAGRTEHRECDNAKHDNKAHGTVTVFCPDCAEFYCETCATYHKTFVATRDHVLRPAADVEGSTALAVKAQERNLKCGEHPDKLLNFYCDTCNVLICTTCFLLTHKQHKCRDLKVVGEEYQKKLEELIYVAEVHVSTVRRQLEELKAYPHSIQRDTNKARQEVKQAANEIRDLATKREQYLLQEIQDVEQKALTEVTSAQEDAELKIATTESLLSYMQTLRDSGNATDQVVYTPDIEKQLRQQQAAPLGTVKWAASFKKETNSVAALNTMLGTVGPLVHEEVKLGQPLNTLKTDLGDGLTGLVVISGCLCATAWRQPDLYIHNTATNVSKLWKLDGVEAVGLTAIGGRDNTLVIPDRNRKLHFVTFSLNSMEITKYKIEGIRFQPQHISFHTVTDQLVLADNTNKAIVMCDTQGNVQNRVTVGTEVGDMWHAVATDDGYVVLDYSNPGRVHWVDSQGRITHTYGNRKDEGLNDPRHMLRTSGGQLVVVDTYNHRLHLVDTSGRLLCYLLTKDDGILQPWSVCLDEATSLLYVGHWYDTHEIWVYNWPRQHGLQVTVGTHK